MDEVAALRHESRRANERRLVVLSGSAAETREMLPNLFSAADINLEDVTSLGSSNTLPGKRLEQSRSIALLGTTNIGIVVDCHEGCQPNIIGRAVGAVDGGGLLVLLTPDLENWPDYRDAFDETLAVPPFDIEDTAGNFRTRLIQTLRQHPGVAILKVNNGREIVRNGLTDPPDYSNPVTLSLPSDFEFPEVAYKRCLTADQIRAVNVFEGIVKEGGVCVIESDRGRGKSSAVGLAAAGHAMDGRDVLITAPDSENVAECFERAHELLVDLGKLVDRDSAERPRKLATETGRIRYENPVYAAELPNDPDLVVVDEAAALPVHLLQEFMKAQAVGYATTIHGYEGAGRSFSVRFRDRLKASGLPMTEVRLDEPIRYAAGDPLEIWSFRALALDAGPAPAEAVSGTTLPDATYVDIIPKDLLDNETLLREIFGLLVLAHYQTEPNDLARLLDAPNVTVRALRADGRVVAVALLAREGGLDTSLQASMYEGQRVRGNMIPDILTSQLRDEEAGGFVGQRVMRIATHPALRSHGFGSKLLKEIRHEFGPDIDWMGVGYGATPELVNFWRSNGYYPVHLSTTRNDTSGEHSVIMLDPTSNAGENLLSRHRDWFIRRIPDTLADSLSGLDPDVVRGVLRSVKQPPNLDLSTMEWRVAAGMANGAATFDTTPRPTRQLALHHLANPDPELLSTREERLLVTKALQTRSWSTVVDILGFQSHAGCMRALGQAVGSLVRRYGPCDALAEMERFN